MKYLEKSAVVDQLTRVLAGLYEEPETHPHYRVNSMQFYLEISDSPTDIKIKAVRAENYIKMKNHRTLPIA